MLPKYMVNAKEFLPTGWPGPLQPGDSDPRRAKRGPRRLTNIRQVFINQPIGTAGELVDELVRSRTGLLIHAEAKNLVF